MDETPAKTFKFKLVYIIAVVFILGGLISAFYFMTNNTKGVIQPSVVIAGDNISVYYTGMLTNGSIFDSNVGKQPLNFVVGSGQVIKGFDQAVVGMQIGQTKNVTIPPADAYGEINPALIITVPLSEFGNQSVSVGMYVTSGSGKQGKITAVNATSAIINFNHPLAGQTLVFEIKVISINK